ncbi:hypothetical protein N7495_006968 [Penicillium taxi]|uniref:uncharacterized protein n=1 Tax=Penicillium taxi TaxID=168475 RepID=UPI002545372A|nr:uncharacterized protein N7495_006968 [Penicillium taxi]KAJ5895277.1 hypothetical protein N7495_006968 [Penicillium taxi]
MYLYEAYRPDHVPVSSESECMKLAGIQVRPNPGGVETVAELRLRNAVIQTQMHSWRLRNRRNIRI